jgi:DNA-binding response OmpR family regulator
MTMAALDGRRIMVVEDEVLIAMLIEASLQDHGCEVVGPFARLHEALRAAKDEKLHAAIMDVNLAGERVFPVAEILWRRSVPFLLLSGYGEAVLPEDRRYWKLQSKPFEMNRVLATVSEMIAAAEPAAR